MDFFAFNPLGKFEIKGKEKSQAAYELIKASEVETRIEESAAKGLMKFVGRKTEMEIFKKNFDKAKLGSRQVLGVVGEAGVGKSRIILELHNMLQQDEYTYLRAVASITGARYPTFASKGTKNL